MRLMLVAVMMMTLAVGCAEHPETDPTVADAFVAAVSAGKFVALHEGLPHEFMEHTAFSREHGNVPEQKIHGYWFYRKRPSVAPDDRVHLVSVVSDRAFYRPWIGEKKCGGFHPDYAVEWEKDGEAYYALLCFGCGEVMIHGPGIESRHDMQRPSDVELRSYMERFRTSRPKYSEPAEL